MHAIYIYFVRKTVIWRELHVSTWCFSDVTVGNCDFFVTSLIAVIVSVILIIFSLLLTREKAVQYSRYVCLCMGSCLKVVTIEGLRERTEHLEYFFLLPHHSMAFCFRCSVY